MACSRTSKTWSPCSCLRYPVCRLSVAMCASVLAVLMRAEAHLWPAEPCGRAHRSIYIGSAVPLEIQQARSVANLMPDQPCQRCYLLSMQCQQSVCIIVGALSCTGWLFVDVSKNANLCTALLLQH